jgi:DEAD/DEAH box helicase
MRPDFRIEKSDSDHVGKQLLLHEHQREAILKAKEGKSYVLTSGTGSGKSLAYIVPIVDHVLRNGSSRGIQAIVVYPMNALANSQDEELGKFLKKGYPEGQSPVRFARYTGQEKGDAREALRRAPPELLTNYMMLELLLTRSEDRELVRAAKGLPYLVFDELHTYRGRQGADVALLIRRCRQAFSSPDSICIGTSATMTSGGTSGDHRREVAGVAESLFGFPFTDQVIGETLERATPQISTSDTAAVEVIRSTIASDDPPPTEYETFCGHKLASWIESTFGVREEPGTGRLIRQAPRRLQGEPIENQKSAAEELAELTGTPAHVCANVLRRFLLQGATLRGSASSRFPIFAFRLHQFLTRGDTVWATIEPEADRYLDLAKKAAKPGEPDKPLFPVVFCRHCGTPYYRVGLNKTEQGSVLLPREDRREAGDDGGEDAYLYVSDTAPWPRTDGTALLDRLPDFMKEMAAQGIERVRADARADVPTPVFIEAAGRLVSEGQGIAAAIIKKNFLFCLEPSCGVAYARSQRSERNKLATLGVDSRSTATTILAVRALLELQQDRDLKPEARKLLSFTDNRQDASLQAGHFNDFVHVDCFAQRYTRRPSSGEQLVSAMVISRGVFSMQWSCVLTATQPTQKSADPLEWQPTALFVG